MCSGQDSGSEKGPVATTDDGDDGNALIGLLQNANIVPYFTNIG